MAAFTFLDGHRSFVGWCAVATQTNQLQLTARTILSRYHQATCTIFFILDLEIVYSLRAYVDLWRISLLRMPS